MRRLEGTSRGVTPGRLGSAARSHVLIERVLDARHAASPGGIRAFARCRNERLRLPAFLDHYRGLGVDQFFIVDNDSGDGSTEYLAGQSDVHLFRTTSRFSEARGGTDWLNALLREFGVGSWCVTVDIDELLVYPGSEHAPLRTLTAYLDRSGHEALACLLLDMYPRGPLHECTYEPGGDLLAAAPCFDVGPYDRSPVDLCPGVLIRGGMRERIFCPELRTRTRAATIYAGLCHRAVLRLPFLRQLPWLRASGRGDAPCLTKVPLVRWDAASEYLDCNHWVSQKNVAAVSGVLLHFKFLHDFHDRAVREVQRAEYYDGASDYQRYARTLEQNPLLTLANDASASFEATSQLVRLGLMRDTHAWVNARSG